jgi:putative tricarboxylic transport membrane protein
MIEMITASITGTAIGFIVGLIPGMGGFAALILCFPFLVKTSLAITLIFYASLIGASQYSGSISALLLGIPGENSSIPIIKLRDSLIKNDNISEAITGTALGSFIGSSLALAVCIFTLPLLSDITFYLKTWITVLMGISALILSMVFSDNKMWINLLLIVFGWILARIGFDGVNNESFMTFGIDYLLGGLPSISILMGLYTIPIMWKQWETKSNLNLISTHNLRFVCSIGNLITAVRSSLIGFLMGLVPYVGINASSGLAFYIEKYLNPTDNVKQAIAAETSNNAATISVLIPLLLFGIAIQPSEAVVLEILYSSSVVVNWQTVLMVLPWLYSMIVFSNLISLVLSFPLVNLISKLFLYIYKFLPHIITIFCMITIYLIGSQFSQPIYYFICLFIFSGIGLVFRNIDMMPLIFSFLLQENLEYAIIRFSKILLSSIN